MKYLKIILKISLIIFLLSIIMSIVVENVVVDTFSGEILSKRVSGYFLDEIIYDVDINDLEIIENNIRNSKTTKEITSKFINTVIENLVNNSNTKMNIQNEVNILISEYMPDDISEEKLQNMKSYVINKITSTEERLQDSLLYSFGGGYLIILKMFYVVTNIYFRIIVAILSIVNIAILCVLEKYNVLKTLRNISIAIVVFMFLVFVLINLLSNFIEQRLSGGWLHAIDTNALIISIIITGIISIILVLVDKVIILKLKK